MHLLFVFLLAVVIQQASNLRQINTTHEVSKQWREPPQWSEQVRIVFVCCLFIQLKRLFGESCGM